jgi:protein ImuB
MLACLFVPLFPLAARLRSEPDLKGEAVAVFEGNGNAARVVAAARKAREKGIQPGMTLPQVRSIFPKLIARARDLESERAAQEALLEIAETFSPRVEDAGEGLAYLDLAGLPSLTRAPAAVGEGRGVRAPSRLRSPVGGGRPQGPPLRHDQDEPEREAGGREGRPYGTESTTGTHDLKTDGERRIARDIISAAEKASLPLRVGIANSKLAARVAAGLPDSPTVVPEGEEQQFLSQLPLSRLAPQIDIAETLERWGIRSIGEFARLPEGEVASRLGELGRELHAAARGIDPRPLEPRLPPPCLSEGMDLEWPLVSLEPFLFLGNAALERLVGRLESQGLACVKLEVTLKLDPDVCDARAIALPAPTREVKTLLTLMRLELEARPPGAPVCGFTFTAHPNRPRRAQLSLFGPAALSPDRLATTIARLAALLGADRVSSPRLVNGHRPERFTEVSYAPPPPPTLARPPRGGRGLLCVRVLRPPVELEVLVEPPPLPAGEGRGEGTCHPERPVFRSLGEGGSEGSAPATSLTTHNSQLTTPSHRLLSLRTTSPGAQPPISGTVRVASGPWSLEDGWWSSEPADRDYWDVELDHGALYRIYRDRATGAWFADGNYD